MKTLYAYRASQANTAAQAKLDQSGFIVGMSEDDDELGRLRKAANAAAASYGEGLAFWTEDNDHNRYNGQDLHPEVLAGIQQDGYWVYAHPEYDRRDWEHEVAGGNTLQSYHEWVTSEIESNEMEQRDGMTLLELNTLHIALQELESKGVEPDTVDFMTLYGIIETERDRGGDS